MNTFSARHRVTNSISQGDTDGGESGMIPSPVVTTPPNGQGSKKMVSFQGILLLFVLFVMFSAWCFYQLQYGWFVQQVVRLERQSKEYVSQLLSQVSNQIEKEYYLMQKIVEQQEKLRSAGEKIDEEDFVEEDGTVKNKVNDEGHRSAHDTGGKKEASKSKKKKIRDIDDDNDTDDEAYDSMNSSLLSRSNSETIPIVIFTYRRAHYLKRCLDTLFKYIPKSGFKIFVSQDGDDPNVASTIQSYGEQVVHLKHERNIVIPPKPDGGKQYYAIAQHFKFGIGEVFKYNNGQFSRIIILEEDIEIAPDFFDFFMSLSPLLDVDTSLYCISAWNDNGMSGFVKDPVQLYRSDFFPGLGWMMTRKLWEEVQPMWPLGFWDDWLRLPNIRRGRACIRPEISRTYTFGAEGASGGQFFSQYLQRIELAKTPVAWNKVNIVKYSKSIYDSEFRDIINNAQLVSFDNIASYNHQSRDLKMIYTSMQDFQTIANNFAIMKDFKSGVPRTAYQGVVTFRYQGNRIFLIPSRPNLLYSNEPPYS